MPFIRLYAQITLIRCNEENNNGCKSGNIVGQKIEINKLERLFVIAARKGGIEQGKEKKKGSYR